MTADLYDLAWRKVRAKRKHAPLEDELLWHKVYEKYIGSLPLAARGAVPELIERHLRIVGGIAGRIAWKRCPRSFGIWANEAAPSLSHVGLVYELTAFGNLGLFIAADRWKPDSGAFSTCANSWIRKYVQLYLEEIIGVVPRTGHMGIEEQGVGPCGPWVVYKPRRSVMDLFDAAVERRRLYRGKAAGGMALFDGSLTIPGPNEGDKEIETVGTEGTTNPETLDYLQRHVGLKDYPWVDMGSGFVPRLELKGHPGGKASDAPAEDESYELEPEPAEVPCKPTLHRAWDYRLVVETTFIAGESGVQGQRRLKLVRDVPRTVYRRGTVPPIYPAEISYLDKRCGSYNSWENFGQVALTPPKMLVVNNPPHWRNGYVFAVAWLRRHRRWRKPSCEEEVWYAALAA